MKTLEQVKHHIAYESGFYSWKVLMDKVNHDNDILEHYIDCVAIVYAELAIDLASERAEITLLSDVYGEFKIDKESILKVKEELK